MCGEILDSLADSACFSSVSIAGRAQHVSQVREPPGHALGASSGVQCEDGGECVLCRSEVAVQNAGCGEVHPGTEFTRYPPVVLGYLTEQCQGRSGLSFGLRTVAESDE